MKKTKGYKIYFVICGLAFATPSTFAQKLPNIQESSIPAPADVRVDGQLTEWGDNLQAYNKATEIFYTISNDRNNLYLVIKASKPEIVSKLAWGGMSFTIKAKKNQTSADNMVFTYPKYDRVNTFQIDPKHKPDPTGDTKNDRVKLDSFVRIQNGRIGQNFKQIEVLGLSDVEPEISVYNDLGIKASAELNPQVELVFEMAIPLRYLNHNMQDGAGFTYNIRLNGASTNKTTMALNSTGRSILVYDQTGKIIGGIPVNAQDMGYSFPTDLTGDYKLFKP